MTFLDHSSVPITRHWTTCGLGSDLLADMTAILPSWIKVQHQRHKEKYEGAEVDSTAQYGSEDITGGTGWGDGIESKIIVEISADASDTFIPSTFLYYI